MGTHKANGTGSIVCRLHEGFGTCEGGSCMIVAGFLSLGTRLEAIQTLAKLLCEGLAEDAEVAEGMDWLQAAETIRVMSENLITATFSEDERRELEKKGYPNKGLWLLELAQLIGEREGGPRLTVERPPTVPPSGEPNASVPFA